MSNLFYFVKPVNETLYNYCIEMEKNVKTNPTEAARELRIVVEFFLKWILELNNISRTKENGRELTIEEMINVGREKNLLVNWQARTLHSLRKYGNQYSHPKSPDEEQKKAKIGELISHVKELHKLLVVYFRYKKFLHDSLYFEEDKLTIQDYQPIRNLNISDYEEGCERKFLCEREVEGSDSVSYYVIRQFSRSDERAPKDINFLTRDLLALQRLSDEDLTYIVKYHNIPRESDNDLFFTCYELSKSDINLVDIDLRKTTVSERLNMIEQIGKGLYGMHHAEEPVYHRALTPSSIYIKVKRSGSRSIKIGNFEYSKLEDVNGVTMFSKLYKRSRDPFRAPELEYGIEIKDWAKTDIYSFGMLILFIFNIQGDNAYFYVSELKKHGLSKEFIEMVERMVDEFPISRPNLQEINKIIQNEVTAYV